MTFYGWEENEWTERARSILDRHGWNYKFERAESCTGREPNRQYVRIVPTIRFVLDNGVFASIEGINAIEKWLDRPDGEKGFMLKILKSRTFGKPEEVVTKP